MIRTVLSARDLTVTFGKGTTRSDVVSNVSLEVAEGQVLVVLGESGSGKTILTRTLIGLEPKEAHVAGIIEIGGTQVRPAPASVRRRLLGNEIGLIAQDPNASLDPMRTVGAQLREVLKIRGRGTNVTREALHRLEQVHIDAPDLVARKYPFELSGGMRQRVSVALALCGEPRLLVADEPSSALDALVGVRVVDLMNELRHDTGAGVVFITHDIGIAARIAGDEGDLMAVMLRGRVVEYGAAATVLERPQHPYTQALLGAEPSNEIPRGHLATVPATLRNAHWGPLERQGSGSWVAMEVVV